MVLKRTRRRLPVGIRRAVNDLRRWAAACSAPRVVDRVRVSYGHDRIPGVGEPIRGGLVKFQRLARRYPNSPREFNVLYLGTSSLPRDWKQQLWIARRRRARVIVNQNGVGYPAWHGPGWEQYNAPMKEILRAADHTFFQSAFCRDSAEIFLDARGVPGEILHNSVDTRFFTPRSGGADPTGGLTLLLGGNQYQRYRIDSALHVLSEVALREPSVRLLVSGQLSFCNDADAAAKHVVGLADRLGVADRVVFTGAFTQESAPGLYRRADILIHTKVNDPCPSVVLEAMSCGLPVVYADSGGTPELVGDSAGIGVECLATWDREVPADSVAMADAVLHVATNLAEFSRAARERAVSHFDLDPWIDRHRALFEELTGIGREDRS